jgi:Ni,Fe-hydrogenase III large subunit/Ni,Fe-hydrogenase III component G
MIADLKEVNVDTLATSVRNWISSRQDGRLGLLTSIDGKQLVTLVLDPRASSAECWTSPLNGDSFRSLTNFVPQAHWFERGIYDLFGITPEQHPRLKHILLHDEYDADFHPLSHRSKNIPARQTDTVLGPSIPAKRDANKSEEVSSERGARRTYKFLEVRGEGVYELPVGPIHAGVIEPGHFRFSCFGETIVNLELRLGFVHRGVERRMTEVDWRKARFVAESAATDTASANAIAHATAVESLFEAEIPPLARALRTLALEIERLAVHIIDVGGMGTDTGFLAVSATAGRLRGKALAMGDMLSGSRFLRGFTHPGGVRQVNHNMFSKMKAMSRELRENLRPILEILAENQTAKERMQVGSISTSLANEFGLVGVAARACGINYDTRQYFPHCSYPKDAPPPVIEKGGDILARLRVRLGEINTSFDVIDHVLDNLPSGNCAVNLPDTLPKNAVGLGIVEAFRGELIHLVFTDEAGNIKRYAIKDPSFNNWTTISIAIRNNLIADFPLCNKSLALSYSGNDL